VKKYPQIMSEESTLANCQLKSIARFGDGEWRCAVGGGCTSQRPEPKLARELQTILRAEAEGCMIGLPNPFHPDAPRRESWIKYTEAKFTSLLAQDRRVYWSSFITRPDNAPWIDNAIYWDNVRSLWRGEDIVLVVGDKKSITTEMIGSEALSVREVIGPRQHAYERIDQIEEEIGKPSGRVLLCLGTTATVLAYRLSKKGIHALDLGHIGMFMRHAGAYRYGLDDMTSPAYRAQLEALHGHRRWGADGAKHTQAVAALWEQYQPKTVLDYGCGENKLAESLQDRFRVSGYDPGIPERAKMPKPCDLVVCTDVLEHVEPAKLDAVLDHIFRITAVVAYFVICTKPANAQLPDGRNAHLSIHPAEWWTGKLMSLGWAVGVVGTPAKDVTIIATKPA
jgi:glycosyltransferase GT-like protein/methyltransferase family protein